MTKTIEGMVCDLYESPRMGTFTKWERDFLENVYLICEEGSKLSEAQEGVVRNIFNKYFG